MKAGLAELLEAFTAMQPNQNCYKQGSGFFSYTRASLDPSPCRPAKSLHDHPAPWHPPEHSSPPGVAAAAAAAPPAVLPAGGGSAPPGAFCNPVDEAGMLGCAHSLDGIRCNSTGDFQQ